MNKIIISLKSEGIGNCLFQFSFQLINILVICILNRKPRIQINSILNT